MTMRYRFQVDFDIDGPLDTRLSGLRKWQEALARALLKGEGEITFDKAKLFHVVNDDTLHEVPRR